MDIYISIGIACTMKYQIDKHFGKKETLFFDWLITDMNSVIKVFQYYNKINNLINHKNLVIKNSKNQYKYVNNKLLTHCTSMHDLPQNFNKKDINNFIDKYRRRINRIFSYIKGTQKIYFMRFGDITNNEKIDFIKAINNINPLCNYVLVVLNHSQKEFSILSKPKYLKLNLVNSKNYKKKNWRRDDIFDWKKVFDIIKEY
jgi:hypothetical protein